MDQDKIILKTVRKKKQKSSKLFTGFEIVKDILQLFLIDP